MANQWRELFSRALNPEVDWTIPDLEELVESFSASITEGEPPLCGTDEDIRLAIRSTFESTQPMAAVLGATLHSLSAPDVFEDTTHLRLLALYAEDVGVGVPNSGRYEWFHQTMREVGFAEECLSRIELVQGSSAPDACFAAPATLLALSRRPDEYAFELLGIDLCFRSVGLLAPWAWVRELTLAGQWDRLDLTHSTNGNSHDLDTLAREIVGGSCADPARVARGQDLGERLLRQWGSAVFAHTRRRLDPRLAMADLLSSRAREAGVYHQHSRLADRSLASWFATAPRDSLDFVDRLAGSRYVRPGDPLRSPLLTRLTAFGGPMFRIFSSEDEQVLSRWITSLAETGPLVPAATQQCQDEAAVPAPPMRSPSPGADAPAPQNLREAYARLTTRSASATATEFARQYVAQWLTRAEASLERHPFPLPATCPASKGDLREWLLAAHDDHARSTDLTALEASVPSRQQVIDSTLQLAPLTLIDGSWLQGFTDVTLVSTRVGSALFETYWDELGNGDISINHPKLFRDVLSGMDITLPPTGSREFALDERIRENSFDLPVYWLAVGRFPVSKLPEILGLNLAMELSGVGGSYRSAKAMLRAHGFPTVFVDIHNTIDNVSTGHSAWAADAVAFYMEALRSVIHDGAILDAFWHRVRVGFASLDPDPSLPRYFDQKSTRSFLRKPKRERRPLSCIRERVTPQLAPTAAAELSS